MQKISILVADRHWRVYLVILSFVMIDNWKQRIRVSFIYEQLNSLTIFYFLFTRDSFHLGRNCTSLKAQAVEITWLQMG